MANLHISCCLSCRIRRAKKLRDIVLVRLEQISPFPHDLLMNVVQQYHDAELVWVQEEPKNMGAWSYVQPRLLTALRHCGQTSADTSSSSDEEAPGLRNGSSSRKWRHVDWSSKQVRYIGRAAAASPATASFAIHQQEMQDIVQAALA